MKIYAPLEFYTPLIPPLLYDYYSRGMAIDDIASILSMKHQLSLDTEEINYILDQYLILNEI
jgi:hypothetical protein